jgi:predicted Zn-dependent protease
MNFPVGGMVVDREEAVRRGTIIQMLVSDAAQRAIWPVIKKNLKPGDALTLFYNARLLGESGQYDAAVLSMRQVLKQLPEDPEVRYHMGRLLGESGDQFGGHLNLAYCYELQHNKKQADFHLEKARSLARDADQKKQVDDFENFRREREELRT